MPINFHEQENIGYVIFDDPEAKVNVLKGVVLERLVNILDEARGKKHLRALVFKSPKPGIFIAGADIHEIEQITEPVDGQTKAKAGQDVMNLIEDFPKPTIAVINGAALGGGCELALACTYRIATFDDKVRIGLPEVNLGFVPGFGGTYRLPRLVGLSESLKMILSGKPVDGKKALKIGLVDRLFPQNNLMASVAQFIEDAEHDFINRKTLADKKKKTLNKFLDDTKVGHYIVFEQSKRNVIKLTKGFYPAPLRAVEVIRQNFYTDRTAGLSIEAQAFGELAISNISKNLVKLFYLSEKFRKLSIDGVGDFPIRPVGRAA
ncbi:MAG: enoyl-CoA hydratase/isomerase family protein, partial [Candidatus Omnitrophica bacterium]|nr:enoyl-CoA hydratase/isomerase family protein [Candidatus Omnitrophota bacterium]